MFISLRDVASLATIAIFLMTVFKWGEILQFVA